MSFIFGGEVSPPILWDTLKAVLRGKIILSYKKKIRNKILEKLQNKLKELKKVSDTGYIRENQKK